MFIIKKIKSKIKKFWRKINGIEQLEEQNIRIERELASCEKEIKNTTTRINYVYRNLMDELSYNRIPLKRSVYNKVRSVKIIQILIEKYTFDTVLDVGCGEGIHTSQFIKAGKHVTALDYGESVYFEKRSDNLNAIIADFNKYEFETQYDCVWCSHVLEHQMNVNVFLKKVYEATKDGGVVCITVPPAKSEIVGGHLSLWNAGLLLYNMVVAGFDCKDAFIYQDDYDVSVIVIKKVIPEEVLSSLTFDSGDINLLKEYLPTNINWDLEPSGDAFDGTFRYNHLDVPCQNAYMKMKPSKVINVVVSSEKQNEYKYNAIVDGIIKGAQCKTFAGDTKREMFMSYMEFLCDLPSSAAIQFWGMDDAFSNVDVMRMIKMASRNLQKVYIHTTLRQLTMIEIEELKAYGNVEYIVYLPAVDERIDDEYIKRVLFFDNRLNNKTYVAVGGEYNEHIPIEIVNKISMRNPMDSYKKVINTSIVYII